MYIVEISPTIYIFIKILITNFSIVLFCGKNIEYKFKFKSKILVILILVNLLWNNKFYKDDFS